MSWILIMFAYTGTVVDYTKYTTIPGFKTKAACEAMAESQCVVANGEKKPTDPMWACVKQ